MSGDLIEKCVYDSSLLLCNNLASTLQIGDVVFNPLSLDLHNKIDKTLSFSFYENSYSCHTGFTSGNSYLYASLFREVDFN